MSAAHVLPAPVQWAQRRNVVFVTICVEDCKDPQIEIKDTAVHFKGVGGPERKEYESQLNLFQDIEGEKSRHFVRDRNIELILVKKNGDAPYWPHLLKDKSKQHWLKVDFSRWKDEDESDDETGGPGGMGGMGGMGGGGDLEEMMRQMGGLGEGGNRPSLDDLEDDDSDDDLPDLE